MPFAAYTLTLSRWHHVADRIKAIGEAKHREALGALGGTTLNHTLAEPQIKALEARGTRALGLIQEAREAMSAVGAIRMALAEANAERGVTRLLAQAEAKRREARMLGDYAGIDLVTRTPVTALNATLASQANQASKAHDAYGRSLGVPVSLVPSDALDFVAAERAALEAEVAAITDQVADLNRGTLELELPIKLAKDAGL